MLLVTALLDHRPLHLEGEARFHAAQLRAALRQHRPTCRPRCAPSGSRSAVTVLAVLISVPLGIFMAKVASPWLRALLAVSDHPAAVGRIPGQGARDAHHLHRAGLRELAARAPRALRPRLQHPDRRADPHVVPVAAVHGGPGVHRDPTTAAQPLRRPPPTSSVRGRGAPIVSGRAPAHQARPQSRVRCSRSHPEARRLPRRPVRRRRHADDRQRDRVEHQPEPAAGGRLLARADRLRRRSTW